MKKSLAFILIVIEIFAALFLVNYLDFFWLSIVAVPLMVLGILFYFTIGETDESVGSFGIIMLFIGIGLLIIPSFGIFLIAMLLTNAAIIGLLIFR